MSVTRAVYRSIPAFVNNADIICGLFLKVRKTAVFAGDMNVNPASALPIVPPYRRAVVAAIP